MGIAPEDVIVDAGIVQLPKDYVDHRWNDWMRHSHSVVNEHGFPVHYNYDGQIMLDPPADYFFGLTRASWLAIPRLSLQEMPPDWQAKFFALVEEAQQEHGLKIPENLHIMRTGPNNRFVDNQHWNNYRRGSVADAVRIDKEKGLDVE